MRRRCSAGFTMLEVLISLVILCVGVLGAVGLQTLSVASNHNAGLRTRSALLAYDMTDRMRANAIPNAANVKAGNYLAGAGDNACKEVHPEHVHVTATACTPAQLAQDDLYEWGRLLARQLPSGTGIVCIDSTPNDGTPSAPACDGIGTSYAIKVWWGERNRTTSALTSDATKHRFVLIYQP
jgi:type IV pilus assembly protein PilV